MSSQTHAPAHFVPNRLFRCQERLTQSPHNVIDAASHALLSHLLILRSHTRLSLLPSTCRFFLLAHPSTVWRQSDSSRICRSVLRNLQQIATYRSIVCSTGGLRKNHNLSSPIRDLRNHTVCLFEIRSLCFSFLRAPTNKCTREDEDRATSKCWLQTYTACGSSGVRITNRDDNRTLRS